MTSLCFNDVRIMEKSGISHAPGIRKLVSMLKQTIRLFEMDLALAGLSLAACLGLFSPRCRDTASPGGSHAVIGYDTSVTETGSEYHGTSVGLGHRSVGALILPQALCLRVRKVYPRAASPRLEAPGQLFPAVRCDSIPARSRGMRLTAQTRQTDSESASRAGHSA
jgi:hypothetical protein